MLIIILVSQLLIVFATKFNEFNHTLTFKDIKRNISFKQQQYLGMDVLPNVVDNFQQIQPITYQESRAIFYLKEIINGQFIGLQNKDSTYYILHKNCTLEMIFQESRSHLQDLKSNCLQLLIDKDQSYLAIIYQDSIILYNIEFNNIQILQYNFSDAITNIKLIEKYILISKGLQGLDLLNFQGEVILNSFMVNENILQASIHANRLLLLFDGGLLIFNFKQAPRLANKILVNECIRFEHNHKLFIIQTKTKIYEYFWKNFIVNQEINIESEVTSISLYQEYLQFISNGYLYQKLVGIIMDDFNLSQIYVSTYQTNSTHIIGYQEKNQLILQKDQTYEIVYWHTLPAFLIFKPNETGILTCIVDLYYKDLSNANSTVKSIHYKIYIDVIDDDSISIQTIIIISATLLGVTILFYLIRRMYLKQKQTEQQQNQKIGSYKLTEDNQQQIDSNSQIIYPNMIEEQNNLTK